jgi:TorA maturation chaperone TorD
LDRALAALRQAARDCSPAAPEEEFNKLFVGLGGGEVMPYASWYLEKKIQSTPLAVLRSELIELGIVRQTGCHEPEDHAAALCEIMAILSRRNEVSHAEQVVFFHRHIAPWMIAFFNDLHSAKSADFYRSVGLFGSSFLETERKYLKPGKSCPIHEKNMED